jgi:hypothetical protein
MCKELLVISVNRAVDKKRIIGKNGGPRRRRRKVHKEGSISVTGDRCNDF